MQGHSQPRDSNQVDSNLKDEVKNERRNSQDQPIDQGPDPRRGRQIIDSENPRDTKNEENRNSDDEMIPVNQQQAPPGHNH